MENVYLLMVWSHVIGHELLKKQIEHNIYSKQVPHSQIFTGPPGYGALAMAIEFSLNFLGLERKDKEALGLGKQSQHPNIHFIYPVVKKGNEKNVLARDYSSEWFNFLDKNHYGGYTDWFSSINVGNKQGVIGSYEIESLHQKMYLKGFGGKPKVCIVWGIEKLNSNGGNAFLKLLEEPPKNTFFILIAEDHELVLPTILSRCQHTQFTPIEDKYLRPLIQKKQVSVDSLLSQANGDYNQLQKLMESDENKEYQIILIEGLRIAYGANSKENLIGDLINWSIKLSEFGREKQKSFLSYGIQFLRDAFLTNYNVKNIITFNLESGFDISKLAPFINNENIICLIELFENTHYQITRNGNAKMLFSNLGFKLSSMITIPGENPVSDKYK